MPESKIHLTEKEREGAVEDFLAYCEQELQRRRYSEADFDQGRYDAAIQLVLGKLRGDGGDAA
ncbi:hypothetical protein [Endothiovibrio diazotrophicus]